MQQLLTLKRTLIIGQYKHETDCEFEHNKRTFPATKSYCLNWNIFSRRQEREAAARHRSGQAESEAGDSGTERKVEAAKRRDPSVQAGDQETGRRAHRTGRNVTLALGEW